MLINSMLSGVFLNFGIYIEVINSENMEKGGI